MPYPRRPRDVFGRDRSDRTALSATAPSVREAFADRRWTSAAAPPLRESSITDGVTHLARRAAGSDSAFDGLGIGPAGESLSASPPHPRDLDRRPAVRRSETAVERGCEPRRTSVWTAFRRRSTAGARPGAHEPLPSLSGGLPRSWGPSAGDHVGLRRVVAIPLRRRLGRYFPPDRTDPEREAPPPASGDFLAFAT